MMDRFLTEVISKPLILNEQGYASLEFIVSQIVAGKPIQKTREKTCLSIITPDNIEKRIFFGDDPSDDGEDPNTDDDSSNPFDEYPEGSVVVIPIIGLMMKYSTLWSIGMDDIASYIRLASASNQISSIILLVNSPGGTVSSVIQLEDAMRNITKPVIGIIDGQASSGAEYVISFCDKILAMNRICQVGNIGTMMSMVNTSDADKLNGYKRISVYPPESKFKNLAIREALDGNTQRLIDEDLTPWAVHFQNIIKENRQNIDLSVEGILEGRDFYAYDAVNNGLIDGIGNLNDAVTLANKIVNERNNTYSLFNQNKQ
jgi:protease-4